MRSRLLQIRNRHVASGCHGCVSGLVGLAIPSLRFLGPSRSLLLSDSLLLGRQNFAKQDAELLGFTSSFPRVIPWLQIYRIRHDRQ